MPNTTATVTSVGSGAAAWETSSEVGRRYGHCATPHATTTEATAPAESTRAWRGRARRRSAREAPPQSAEMTTNGSARDVSPSKTCSASAWSTKMPARPAHPATSAAPTARRRKYSIRSGCSARAASRTRYTAARYAHTVTAITPPTIEVEFTQLDHGSPALPPAGTRPDAIAPATAPMQYGTRIDEDANAAPKLRRDDVRCTSLRNAKLE